METVQQDQAQEIFKLTFLRTSLGPDRPATSDARFLPQNEIHELPCEPHFLVYSKTASDRTTQAYFTPYKWLPIGGVILRLTVGTLHERLCQRATRSACFRRCTALWSAEPERRTGSCGIRQTGSNGFGSVASRGMRCQWIWGSWLPRSS